MRFHHIWGPETDWESFPSLDLVSDNNKVAQPSVVDA